VRDHGCADACGSYAERITLVTHRAAHDRQYALDARRIERALGAAAPVAKVGFGRYLLKLNQ